MKEAFRISLILIICLFALSSAKSKKKDKSKGGKGGIFVVEGDYEAEVVERVAEISDLQSLRVQVYQLEKPADVFKRKMNAKLKEKVKASFETRLKEMFEQKLEALKIKAAEKERKLKEKELKQKAKEIKTEKADDDGKIKEKTVEENEVKVDDKKPRVQDDNNNDKQNKEFTDEEKERIKNGLKRKLVRKMEKEAKEELRKEETEKENQRIQEELEKLDIDSPSEEDKETSEKDSSSSEDDSSEKKDKKKKKKRSKKEKLLKKQKKEMKKLMKQCTQLITIEHRVGSKFEKLDSFRVTCLDIMTTPKTVASGFIALQDSLYIVARPGEPIKTFVVGKEKKCMETVYTDKDGKVLPELQKRTIYKKECEEMKKSLKPKNVVEGSHTEAIVTPPQKTRSSQFSIWNIIEKSKINGSPLKSSNTGQQAMNQPKQPWTQKGTSLDRLGGQNGGLKLPGFPSGARTPPTGAQPRLGNQAGAGKPPTRRK